MKILKVVVGFFLLLFFFLPFSSSSGGVVTASRDGKIVCENTLDARLNVVFRSKLPEVCMKPINSSL